MIVGPIGPVPINTGTIHTRRSPIDVRTVHIHESPNGIGNVHVHKSMKVKVWIP